jgi:hypothetical protein
MLVVNQSNTLLLAGFRSISVVAVPSDYGMEYEDVELECSDGVRVKAYLMLQKDDALSPTSEKPTSRNHGVSGSLYSFCREALTKAHRCATSPQGQDPRCCSFMRTLACIYLSHLPVFDPNMDVFRECGPSYSSRSHVLQIHQMQCHYAFLSWVRQTIISSVSSHTLFIQHIIDMVIAQEAHLNEVLKRFP